MVEQLNLVISLKKKHVTFSLTENGQTISLENKKISTKNLYDVAFFEDYFEKREDTPELESANLVTDFENYCREAEKDKLHYEELWEAYEEFKENRDRIQEFEVVLAEDQIDQLVKEGIFIRINYGIKKDGLVFIPNCHLDIKETDSGKSYHVFICETAQFFIYHKENSGFNRYMRGSDLIRQLTNDSQTIPKQRRARFETLKHKIDEINLLIELNIDNKSFQEVKDGIIKDIAQLDLVITDLQDHIAYLNRMAEVLINLNNSDPENRRLANHDYVKMNLTAGVTLRAVESELRTRKKELNNRIDNYEYQVKKLERMKTREFLENPSNFLK